ncbi:hypothetical protein [Aquimarina algiphila]|uniref:Uncharacterized protein n=1 Tax=Aquimarina algiphila TaxID=2047982 RepID=A0A554VJ61_9FLAO|nr:hypothetical protein [Aquimarina algiphila]TSE07928.1 hypothetical protein FOF46_14480 [Aquimarina algiphila]
MKNIIKYILIGINIIGLIAIFIWYYTENPNAEPIVVGIAQVGTLLTILFEKRISRNSSSISKIDNSDVDVEEVSDGRDVKITEVSRNSRIKYRRNK